MAAATVDTESTNIANPLPDLTLMSWIEVLEGLNSSLDEDDDDEDYDYDYGPAERMAQHLLSLEDVPDDVRRTVERTYLQCLLWMERWSDVVKFASGDDGGGTSAELAYAYYRLARYGSAKSICLLYLQGASSAASCIVDMNTKEWSNWWKQYTSKTPMPEEHQVYLHILAQCCYRQSDVQHARSIYHYLTQGNSDEQDEVATNLEASWIANHALLPLVVNSKEATQMTTTSSNTDRRVNEILHKLADHYPSLSSSLVQDCQSQLLKWQKEEEGSSSEEIDAALGWCDALLQGGTATTVLDEWLARGNACPSTIRLPGLLNKAAPAIADSDPIALEMALLSLRMYFHEVGLLTGPTPTPTKPIVALHVRVALYNRVVLLWHLSQKKSGTYTSEDVRVALADLQKLLWGKVTVSTTAGAAAKKKKVETEGGKKGAAPKKSKKWTLQQGKIPHLPLASPVENRFWSNASGKFEGQVYVLEQEISQAHGILQTLLKETRKEASSSDDRWDYVIADMQLYLSCWEQEYLPEEQKPKRPSLRSLLPASLHSSPAVVATMAQSLTGPDLDSLLERAQPSSSSADALAKFADWQRRLGRHDESVECWESVLAAAASSEQNVVALAGLVKALSFVDPNAAMERAADLPSLSTLSSNSNAKTLTAEELEQMPIPTPSGTTAGGKKKKSRSAGATSADDSKAQEKRQAILRKRAKRREAYLKKLESQGRYDFSRPTPPDPERWIPKQERASNKQRCRGTGGNAKGSQGAGGGGMDAARLDVAARMAARADGGGVDASMGPSTAHMEVAGAGSGNRRGGRRR